jgi:myo-inositol-1(or 4)-monophosphatase
VNPAGCASLCSRSIGVLQKLADQRFPGKIRLLGVASLNLVSVGMGQTVAALEATPKIWDLAAAWLVLTELHCPIRWLINSPEHLEPGADLTQADFPVLAADRPETLERFLPWGEALVA